MIEVDTEEGIEGETEGEGEEAEVMVVELGITPAAEEGVSSSAWMIPGSTRWLDASTWARNHR